MARRAPRRRKAGRKRNVFYTDTVVKLRWEFARRFYPGKSLSGHHDRNGASTRSNRF